MYIYYIKYCPQIIRYRVDWMVQLKLVTWRVVLEFKRNPRLVPARIIQLIVCMKMISVT